MIHIFIINHFAGNKHLAMNLRNHLSTKKDIRYFVFNTIQAGFERDIVKKIQKYFEGEKLRFYCCGGSGTMRNMLDGFEDLTNIEVAFFPCGITNDFLKCFGEDMSAFQDIDNLIEGQAVAIDYIKTNHGIALNTLSLGIDANVETNMRAFRVYDIFGGQVPYIMSLLAAIFFTNTKKYEVIIDGESSAQNYAEIIFGNGYVFGGNLFFSDHANVMDGIASYMTAFDVKGFGALKVLLKTMTKGAERNTEKVESGECKTIEIRALDDKPLYVNYDGELVECDQQCKAWIVQKGLNFVMPKGMSI